MCGCGASDADDDGDSVANCVDVCPGNDDVPDTDGDGVPDCADVCPVGDDNIDTDADGAPDACDNCPTDPRKILEGACGCGSVDTPGCLLYCEDYPGCAETASCPAACLSRSGTLLPTSHYVRREGRFADVDGALMCTFQRCCVCFGVCVMCACVHVPVPHCVPSALVHALQSITSECRCTCVSPELLPSSPTCGKSTKTFTLSL